MDCRHYITDLPERKSGQHLQREERGAIQALKRQGLSNRAIARELGCSPTTIGNELRRGTPPRKSNKGRKPGYSARHGEAVYKANRKHSRKHHRICRCAHFLRWVVKQFKEHKWSLDSCVGYARLHGLFTADEMVCTRTLYNEVWAGNLDLSVTELPEAMKRKQHKDSKPREHKKSFGTDISQRPEIAALRIEEGHWEGDTVVGKRAGKEAVVLSLLEKKTENYIAIQIPGKDADSVLNSRQGCRLRSERHAIAQGGIRRQVLTGLQDHYRGQRFGVLYVQSGRELGQCSLLCTSLYFVGTSPKRASQWAVPSLRAQGCLH